MKKYANLYLKKNEDANQYKKFADEGMDLMHMVTIGGKSHRPDINIPYHATIKLFDTKKDKPEHVDQIASKLSLHPPDSKSVGIEPVTLQGRTGYTIHAIKLHGPDAERIKEHHKNFEHMGYKQNYEFHPHISVDKPTWDKIVESKARTAHDAGIEFHPAELHHKKTVVAKYKDPKKLAASEDLEKGFLRNIGTTLGVAGAIATSSPTKESKPPSRAPASINRHALQYTPQRMLNAIATVESQKGKYTNHKEMESGPQAGEKAYGRYGLMPSLIRDTIHMDHGLSAKHGKAAKLSGDDLKHYMDDNKGLEDQIAQTHLKRLEHHFGQDPAKISYGWLNGIRGTNRALKQKKDINTHWHVKKVKDAYSKE